MYITTQKFLIGMLIAMHVGILSGSEKQVKAENVITQQPTAPQEINPIPEFIKKYTKEHPCIGYCCCSSNPEHHESIHLSVRGSKCQRVMACQIREVDPYNSQSFKWDGTHLDTLQSVCNLICYYPKRECTGMMLADCITKWYNYEFARRYPYECQWDLTHEIDWKNRRIKRI